MLAYDKIHNGSCTNPDFVVSVRLQNVLECIGNTLCTVDRLHFSLKEIFEDKIYLV
jgi:hypothetical protein